MYRIWPVFKHTSFTLDILDLSTSREDCNRPAVSGPNPKISPFYLSVNLLMLPPPPSILTNNKTLARLLFGIVIYKYLLLFPASVIR